ncbi:MAG: helicase-exonuclease AddAB subunit AddA [Oscillospiraceae bacterium]|jgi:ATP-dependent helicase/nuclease subunit A|nr:helicase-exonuclease AddAB subunit AddA [Oscillospiraceae bacterium]
MSVSQMNFTQEQEAAIKHRGDPLLVSAAAGSGKTKVLVERLLGYIDEGNDVDEFLVITYSRAAAHELRERIYEEILTRLSNSPGNVRLRRQSMLCKGASIDTIHAFCSEILRENAHIVGLPFDFRVADDGESNIIRSEVLDSVLSESYEDIDQYIGFTEIVNSVVEGRDDKMLIEIVLDMYSKLQSTPYPHDWIDKQSKKLSLSGITDITQTESGAYLLKKIKNTVEFCKEEMYALRREMKIHQDFELRYAQSVDETIIQIDALLTALSIGWDEARRLKTIEFPRPKPISGYADLKEIRSRCQKELSKCAAELENSSEEHLADMRTVNVAISALLSLVLRFGDAYSLEKKRRGVADFSDLEHLTLSLLIDKDTGERTELAKSISTRYKEIMVDEYQDVNAVQELIFNAVSRNGENIFMVGDVKQSIYRFRLADPTIFLSKYKSFTETTAQKSLSSQIGDIQNKAGTKIHLSRNFRSHTGILDTVNHIFKNIMSIELGELEYTKKEWLIAGRTEKKGIQGKQGIGKEDSKSEPAVEISVLDMSDLQVDDDEEAPGAVTLEAEYIATKIKELTDREYMIPDDEGGERAAVYSDIVILLRSIKGKAWQYAKALQEKGIPTEFPGGEGFFETVEISAVLALLSVIDNPMQDIPLAAVLSGPIYGFTSDELAEIRAAAHEKDFYNAIKESAERESVSGETSVKCRNMLTDIDQLRAIATDMPSDRFIWHVYNKTGILGLVSAMTNGKKRHDNLILLAESAGRFENSGYKGLFGFLTYIRSLQERGETIIEAADTSAAGSDLTEAVRIMSIHKSKGLEFPIVFLANTVKRNNYNDIRKSVVFHKDFGIGTKLTDKKRRVRYNTLTRSAIQRKLTEEMLSEELRVLYVAMTRAKEKLIISCIFKDAHEKLEKLSMITQRSTGAITPYTASSMSSMAEWIITGAYGNESKECEINVVSMSPEGEYFDKNNELTEYIIQDSVYENAITDTVADENVNYINPFVFEYPFKGSPDLPSKMTVTKLSTLLDPEAVAATWTQERSEEQKLRPPPSFIVRDIKRSGAEYGTLLHHVMQYIDYVKCTNEHEVQKELQRLEKAQILTANEINDIDIEEVTALFNSKLGTRIIKAKDIKREFKFSILESAEHLYKGSGNDKIMLQGVVDCFFEEEGEIVVVDFKSDRVTYDTIGKKVEHYTPQINIYSRALERITGKKVKERILYFFRLNKAYFV